MLYYQINSVYRRYMSPKQQGQKRASPANQSRAPGDARKNITDQQDPPPDVAGPAIMSTTSNGAKTAWLKHRHLILAGLVFLTFLVLYFITTSRYLPTGDSGELISASWIWGVAHPPGYPTFTILSRLAGYLPFGSPAFRLNLLSALLGALAMGILFWGVLRLLQAEKNKNNLKSYWLIPIAGSIAGIAVLGVSSAFWLYSTRAEVFALNNFFAAVTIVLMLEWVRRPGERKRLLWFSGLSAGLAMTNQQTFILLMPGLLTLLAGGLIRWHREMRRPTSGKRSRQKVNTLGWHLRDVGITAGLFVAGLLPYIYLPIAASADPAINFGNPSNFANFWQVVTRASYGTFSLLAGSAGGRLQALSFLGQYFYHAFTPVGIALATIGIVWFAQRKRLEGIALGLAFIFSGPLFAVYSNPPLSQPLWQTIFERFLILPGIPLALFIAAGAELLIETIIKLAGRLKATVFMPQAIVVTGLVAVAGMAGGLGAAHLPVIDLNNNQVMLNYGQDILKPLAPNALLITNGDHTWSAVYYAQQVLGIRKDVVALHIGLLPGSWYVAEQRRLHPDITIPFSYYSSSNQNLLVDLVNANINQRPVYVAWQTPEDLSKSFDEVYWGLTDRLLPKGQGTDPYALMKSNIGLFTGLHFPGRYYPDTYWENMIVQVYGKLAYRLGIILQQPEAQPDAALVEKMYRQAITDSPLLWGSYKNLGLVLWKNGGSPSEIISLWEKYLVQVPNDPNASDMRTVINQLKQQQ